MRVSSGLHFMITIALSLTIWACSGTTGEVVRVTTHKNSHLSGLLVGYCSGAVILADVSFLSEPVKLGDQLPVRPDRVGE